VTEGYLREFLRVSDANIRRQNKMEHILDEQEIEQCAGLMSALTEIVLLQNQPN